MNETVILRLIRHGQTAFNAEGRYMGRTDVDLCDKGREQIRSMFSDRTRDPGKAFHEVMKLDPMLFSSPMKRCIQTASIILPEVEPVILKDLREMDFGIFEGMLYEDLNKMPEFRAFTESSGQIAPPGGEGREEFIKRVVGAVNESLGIIRERGNKAGILVMHGGTIMALMTHLFGGDYYDYLPQNGGGYTLKVTMAEGKETVFSLVTEGQI